MISFDKSVWRFILFISPLFISCFKCDMYRVGVPREVSVVCRSSGGGVPGNNPSQLKSGSLVEVNGDEKPKNDGFEFLNCSFLQDYGTDMKDRYNCCWLIVPILALLNVPAYQNFIKNYKYDNDEKNLNLKMIKDIYEELRNKNGNYDIDFRKHYEMLYDHGLRHYASLFEKGTKDNPHPAHDASNFLISDYYATKQMCKPCLFDFTSRYLHFRYELADKSLEDKVSTYFNKIAIDNPRSFILDKILDNSISKFLGENPVRVEKYTLDNVKFFDVQVAHPYFRFVDKLGGTNGNPAFNILFFSEDKMVLEDIGNIVFKEYKKEFGSIDKIDSSNIDGKIENLKGFDKVKKSLDNYNFEFNSALFKSGHYTAVVKDPRSGKFYNLDSNRGGSVEVGEIRDFLKNFGDTLKFSGGCPEWIFVTVTKKSE